MSAPLTKIQKILLGLAMVLALGLRVQAAVRDTSVPEKDAYDYDQMAMNLVKGAGYRDGYGNLTAYRLPGYSLFIAAIYRVAGHDYQAARMVQAILSVLTALMIALWAHVLFGGTAACWAAFLAAVYPPFYAYYFSCNALVAETLYVFLLTASLFTFFSYFSYPSRKMALASGIFWGLAVLTRGVPLFLVAVLPIVMLALRYPLDRIVRYHLMVWLAVGCLLVPWTVRNYKVFGTFVPLGTNLGENFYLSNHAGSDGMVWKFFREGLMAEEDQMRISGMSEPERSKILFARGMDFIRSKPKEAFFLFWRKVYIYLDPRQTVLKNGKWVIVPNWGYILAAFGSLFGFWEARRDKNSFRPILLSCFIFGYFLFFHAVVQSMDRYRFATEPILIVIASFFFARWIRGKNRSPDTVNRHHEA